MPSRVLITAITDDVESVKSSRKISGKLGRTQACPDVLETSKISCTCKDSKFVSSSP